MLDNAQRRTEKREQELLREKEENLCNQDVNFRPEDFDREKMNYYLRILQRHNAKQNENRDSSHNLASGSAVDSVPPNEDEKSIEGPQSNSAVTKQDQANHEVKEGPSSFNFFSDKEIQQMSPEELQQALGIHRAPAADPETLVRFLLFRTSDRQLNFGFVRLAATNA
jgi:hypothetical protein